MIVWNYTSKVNISEIVSEVFGFVLVFSVGGVKGPLKPVRSTKNCVFNTNLTYDFTDEYVIAHDEE
jgi:hypothetical protein